MRFSQISFVMLVLGLTAPIAAAQGKHEPAPSKERSSIVEAHDLEFGIAHVPGLQTPSPSTLKEHQILFVMKFSYVAGHSRVSSQNTRTSSHLLLNLSGKPSPSTKVERAHVNFWPGTKTLPPPSYLDKQKLIIMNFPMSKYPAIDRMLRQSNKVYAQFREYSNGHLWADIHVGHLDVK